MSSALPSTTLIPPRTPPEWYLGDVAEFKVKISDQEVVWKHVFDASNINLSLGGLQHDIGQWVRKSLSYDPDFYGEVMYSFVRSEGFVNAFTPLRSMRGRTLWFTVTLPTTRTIRG